MSLNLKTQPTNAKGQPIVVSGFEDTGGLHPKWRGNLYSITAGATNIFDIPVTTERELRGGWYQVLDANAAIGDYIEEAVVDKDDALGLFATYGLTVGVDVLELKKYVVTEYVNPRSTERQEFRVDSTMVVYAGLYIRTIYESVGATDLKLGVSTFAYE